jgi:hypothetical protein
MMTCPEVEHRLDDYIDGTLPEEEFHQMELHLQGCASCGEEERLVRAILAHAGALPREATLPVDLWPGIADRIARGEVLGSRPGARQRSQASWVPALAAAVVVLALGSLVPRRSAPVAAPADGLAPAAFTNEPPLLEAELAYARAATELREALNARRASLPPETLKTVDANLAIIDTALRSLRDALRKDPSNPELAHLLTSTHKKKLELLTRVTKLSSRV